MGRRLLDYCCHLSARRRFKRWLISSVLLFIVAAILTFIVVIVLRFAINPKVKADIDDARLNSFALATTIQNDTRKTMSSFLAYNISVVIGIRNPNTAMSFTYTKQLVAAIVFDDQRLYITNFTDEGQKQPPSKRRVHALFAEGNVSTAAVEEFKKQKGTGMFTMEVRLSGEITLGLGNTRILSQSCPLNLRLAPSSPVVVLFNKVNCVAVDPGENYI